MKSAADAGSSPFPKKPARGRPPINIDRAILKNLYSVENLPLNRIAAILKVAVDTVKKVLLTNNIPNRRALFSSGENVDLLKNLYSVEKLPLERIAATLRISVETVNKALLVNNIPKRRLPHPESKNSGLLKKLQIGDQIEIKTENKYPQQLLRSIARRLGIKISLKHLGAGKFSVTRVDKINRQPKHQIINQERLRELYEVERLSLEKIAAALGCSLEVVGQALAFHAIPKRSSLKFGGSRVALLRALSVGEETVIRCSLKFPLTNFHTIARRTGIKISVRSLGENTFRIKKLAENIPAD